MIHAEEGGYCTQSEAINSNMRQLACIAVTLNANTHTHSIRNKEMWRLTTSKVELFMVDTRRAIVIAVAVENQSMRHIFNQVTVLIFPHPIQLHNNVAKRLFDELLAFSSVEYSLRLYEWLFSS